MTPPEIVRTAAELRERVRFFRAEGERVALVPTMGALHEGHLALVERARREAVRVVVSIFVNPRQFAPHEDLATYPRTLDADVAALADRGVSVVYAPDVIEMYPEGDATVVTVGGPSAGLETDFRPHFFAGVATVVTKLLVQCLADVAVFGEKDYQQLAVVRRLVRDLSIPTEIVGVETSRESDGLAMSSRNIYLSPEARAAAPALHHAIAQVARDVCGGRNPQEALMVARSEVEAAGFAVDYLELRNAATLGAFEGTAGEPGRVLVAARIGGVRLIDNIGLMKPD